MLESPGVRGGIEGDGLVWVFWRLREVDAVESDVSGGWIRGAVIG